MKIGIVSDTHGDFLRLRAAMKIFAGRGVEAVVHCGDIGSTQCLYELCSAAAAYAVAGNVDRDLEHLKMEAGAAGVNFAEEVISLDVGKGPAPGLAATHGHVERILSQLIDSGRFRYVCHGHTHRQRDQRIGNVRIINPGAIHNPRQPHYPSVAVLDTESDSLEFIELPKNK